MLEKMWSSVIVAWKQTSSTLLDLLADDNRVDPPDILVDEKISAF